MTHTLDTQLDRHSSTALGVFRIIVGLLFTLHGTSKLFGWPSSATGTVPVGTWPFWWAGVIELVVGLLVLLGLFTRLAALIGSGEMAFAYFMRTRARASILWSMAATPRYSTVSRSCISYFPGPGYGAWMPECSGATRRNPHLSVI